MPVLALSQLSRAVEQRDEKIPQLADLKSSGSGKRCDVVMFVYREALLREKKMKLGQLNMLNGNQK